MIRTAHPAPRRDYSRSLRRVLSLLTALAATVGLLVGGLGNSPAGAAPAAATAPAGLHVLATPRWAHLPQQTTLLRSRVRFLSVYPYKPGKAPSQHYGVVIHLHNPTPQGYPLVMAGYGSQNGFVLAELPVSTNNYFGWVKLSDVYQTTTPYRVEISQSRHTLLLWQGRSVVGAWPVAVGKPSTPTPLGYFFVNAVIPAPNAAYGTVVISTSGFSNVLKTFGSGDAAIGIHGTDEDSSVGHSVSHGCVRMHTRDAQFLAHFMKLGTSVVIER